MQRQLTFGGGVSPRSTRLRGQSIIEYVLIIAIIGLVIVFAGPGVAGAIRNQFNLVGNTVNSGTTGGVDGGASGGGSTGADSATVQAAVAKDAKDWTLDEQKAVAEDIAAKGEASPAYAKAKAAMDAWTRWSIKLTNGATMRYRIVGINHDDLADGSGKAGLTFLTNNIVTDAQKMNASHTNVGGWEKSKLRERLNSGDIWALLPAELAGKIEPVEKMTDNQGAGKAGVPTATTDRVFLLSTTEIYGNLDSDGTQYEFYAAKGVTQDNYSVVGVSRDYWTRSTYKWDSEQFMVVTNSGEPFHSYAANITTTYFAWCF